MERTCINGHTYDTEQFQHCPYCNEFNSGDVIDGRYEIETLIGKGGMSSVYLVLNKHLNKLFALKKIEFINTDIDIDEYYYNNPEIELLKKLNSPYFPKIIDVIRYEHSVIIVMDYIEGENLQAIIDKEGKFEQKKVIHIAQQLCEALGYLHNRSIIFRDVKPSNIILKPDGNICMIDFGIAKQLKNTDRNDTAALGTIGYASPEHFGGHGRTDQRSDIFSLGVTLYYLLTGLDPSYKPMLPLREINPDFSIKLEHIISKCTELNPKDRYQNCDSLLRDLNSYDLMSKPNIFARIISKFFSKKSFENNANISGAKYENKLEPIINTSDLSDMRRSVVFYRRITRRMPTRTIKESDDISGGIQANEKTNTEPKLFLPRCSAINEDEKYIFISYAHKDNEKAINLIRNIINCGLRVWYDDGIDPGTEWHEFITERITNCSYFISLASHNYFQSENCTGELNYSIGRVPNRLIIYIEDVIMPDKFQLHHGMIQAIHQYRYKNMDVFLNQLIHAKGMDISFFVDGRFSKFSQVNKDILSRKGIFDESKRVFIAYSTDSYMKYARSLIKQLETEQVSLWHKLEYCTSDENYFDEAKGEIEISDRFVFFLSQEFLNDKIQKQILDMLISQKKSKDTVFGIICDDDLKLFSDYDKSMTIISCSNAKFMKQIAKMII